MNGVPFEARYLDVTWLDRDTVQRLSASVDPIHVKEEEGGWRIDTKVFKAAGLRLGFRVLDRQLIHPPYFRIDEDVCEELITIVDPVSGDTWWIENSGWDVERRRYHSRLQRSVGTARLGLQNRLITIYSHSLNFTTDELEAYLSDFKNDLWGLIFDPRSTVQGRIGKETASILGEELLRCISDFICAAERVGERMEVELKQIVEMRSARSVRPITATFRELATRGPARQLSSKGFGEVKDIAVNRYAHHLVNRLRFMVGRLRRMAHAHKATLQAMAQQFASSAAEIALQTTKTIDEAVFRSELAKLEAELQAACNSVREQDARFPVCESRPSQGYVFRLRPMPRSDDRQFYCAELDGDDFEKKFKTYCIVSLPKPVGKHVAKLSQHGQTRIRLLGLLSKSTRNDKSDRKYYRIDFDYVEHIEFIGPTAVDHMRKKMAAWTAKDWRISLTPRERQELQHESRTLAVRAAAQSARVSELDDALRQLDFAERRLSKLGRKFVALKVGTCTTLPQSMTYVRNPNYVALKTAYDRLNSLGGADDNLLDSMVDVENMGLVNISNLYEKWCLLQIVKVLRDCFGFEPVDGWQKTVVDGVLGRDRNISVSFKRAGEWTATLTYEKVLANNRRPDFVFDLSTPRYEQLEPESGQWFNTGLNQAVRVVMDAKFRERWRPDELAELLEQLCIHKDYSEDGKNQVFILHPCEDHAQQPTSPLVWGRGSDYGQLHDHKRGVIHLSPQRGKRSTTDNLQRLFGMIFQQASHYLRDAQGWEWTDASCVGCGQGVDGVDVHLKYGTTKAGKERWEFACRACQLSSLRTNCYGCGRVLFKNGHYWTYHRTRAESLSNIVCPDCERFFDTAFNEAS